MPRENTEVLSSISLVTGAADTDDQGLAVQVRAARAPDVRPGVRPDVRPGVAIIAGEAPGGDHQAQVVRTRARGHADRGAEPAVAMVELNQTGNKWTIFFSLFSLIPEISLYFPTLSQHSALV